MELNEKCHDYEWLPEKNVDGSICLYGIIFPRLADGGKTHET
jgi:hypothetical protein